MQINTFHNTEGAKEATGLTVIIDVFRAFTTECYAMAAGADKIIPVGNLDTAYQLKVSNPDYLLMGEQGGEKPAGFDYGNSPFQISNLDLTGKKIVHISSAGTKGLSNAKGASTIITGSFVNAQAIINYIKMQNPQIVSLVCTGTDNETIRDEDALCAEYIKESLRGNTVNFVEMRAHIIKSGCIDRFLDPNILKYPIEDVDCCLALDKFDFVLKSSPYNDNGNLVQLTL